MAALPRNIAEIQASVANLIDILREGRDGNERSFSDEAIANWCYEFFASNNLGAASDSDHLVQTAKKVALEVSLQWEADFLNASDRVLSADLFKGWLLRLDRGDA